MADAVDVTKHNFEAALQNLKAAVHECDFVAFDCEMTGLFLDNNDHSYLDDLPIRYYKMRASARQFLVQQFGVAAFSRTAEGVITAKTFNFNIFPRSYQGLDKRFTCQASSLEYLSQHKFDFNKMVYDGIPYIQLQQKHKLIQDVDRPRKYFRRDPSTDASKQLCADIKSRVTDWHTSSTESTITLAEGFRPADRALAYQALEQLQLGDGGSPGFHVKKIGDGPADVALLVTRASKIELQEHERLLRQKRIDDIEEATGFSKVLAVLQAAGKPVVGHNMLFDLIYVLNIFVSDYPTWADFKRACEIWFPGGIYDTKHIVKALESRHGVPAGGEPLFVSTSLGDLYEVLVEGRAAPGGVGAWSGILETAGRGNGGSTRFDMPRVEHAQGFTRYAGTEGAAFAHEAGFDAFMTGAVFACAVTLKSASDSSRPAEEGAPEPPVAPGLVARPFSGSSTDAPALAAPASGSGVDLGPVSGLQNRVNLLRTNMPYCVVSTGADPVLPRPEVVIVAARQAWRLPERKAAYAALASGVAATGRVGGMRVEQVVSGGEWGAWAAVTWGVPDQEAYTQTLLRQMREQSRFRKCEFMTWPDFEEWRKQFPDNDPYGSGEAPRRPADGGSSSGDVGVLQWAFGNNCAVM